MGCSIHNHWTLEKKTIVVIDSIVGLLTVFFLGQVTMVNTSAVCCHVDVN